MLIDSHCHLNFSDFSSNFNYYLEQMAANDVRYALCVGTNPQSIDQIVKLIGKYPNLFGSVGIHPDERLEDFTLSAQYLLEYTNNPKIVAIGETGLDYYRVTDDDMSWQHERFILHIEVAKQSKLPLIIHTRNSIKDTIKFMQKHGADQACGVMHCFTETVENARLALDLGFYISLSGIVTFKNAEVVKQLAKYVPLDRLLVETDAPFLAPVPFRGKLNHPALVKYTAQEIAKLRQLDFEKLAHATTENFLRLFNKVKI